MVFIITLKPSSCWYFNMQDVLQKSRDRITITLLDIKISSGCVSECMCEPTEKQWRPEWSQGWKLFFCPLWWVWGCVCGRLGQPGANRGGLGSSGRKDELRGMEGEEVSRSLAGKGVGMGWWPTREVERRLRWSERRSSLCWKDTSWGCVQRRWAEKSTEI